MIKYIFFFFFFENDDQVYQDQLIMVEALDEPQVWVTKHYERNIPHVQTHGVSLLLRRISAIQAVHQLPLAIGKSAEPLESGIDKFM